MALFYNRITKSFIVDPVDYFLLSALITNVVFSYIKSYFEEDKIRKRLRDSVISKSKKISPSKNVSHFNRDRTKKIFKFAVSSTRGGDLQKLELNDKIYKKMFLMAQKIQKIIEELAIFLKKRELKGTARIFFKSGRMLLELILHGCRIRVSYMLLDPKINNSVIIVSTTLGMGTGYILSWIKAVSILSCPVILALSFLTRSVGQQIGNQKAYLKFKKSISEGLFSNNHITAGIEPFLVDEKELKKATLQMQKLKEDKNILLEFNFNSNNNEITLDQYIKDRMKEEFSLIENPDPQQIRRFLKRKKSNRIQRKKSKTTLFLDFVNQFSETGVDAKDIDPEIINTAIIKENY